MIIEKNKIIMKSRLNFNVGNIIEFLDLKIFIQSRDLKKIKHLESFY